MVFVPSTGLPPKYKIYNENCPFSFFKQAVQFLYLHKQHFPIFILLFNRNIFTLSFCFPKAEIQLNTFHYTLFACKKAITHLWSQLSWLYYSSGILCSELMLSPLSDKYFQKSVYSLLPVINQVSSLALQRRHSKEVIWIVSFLYISSITYIEIGVQSQNVHHQQVQNSAAFMKTLSPGLSPSFESKLEFTPCATWG